MQDVQTGVPDEEDRAETEEGRMSFFRTIGNALRASQQGNPGGRGISSSIREPGPPSLVRGTFQRYIYSPSDTYNAKLCMVEIGGSLQICRLATDAQLKVAAEPTPGSGEESNATGLPVWCLKMDNGGYLILGPAQ